ncbi:MAG TPA: PfkB family carbohydrate kinase [Anaerolineae bacterium]|jgi:rfaE bifunctional protein kinase chain/domain
MKQARLAELLQSFPSLHILVVGDFFLDKYLSLDPDLSEISLETGLEAYQVVEIRHSPGAAGTVAANLCAMDIQVSALGVIGQDGAGFDLRQGLLQRGVNIDGLIEQPNRFTPTYMKPMLRASGAEAPSRAVANEVRLVERELNRFDIKNRRPLPPDVETALILRLDHLLPQVNGVIIADQVQERNCGVVTDRVRAALAKFGQAHAATIFAADSRVRIGEFEQVIIKPNLPEAVAAVQALDGERLTRIENPGTGELTLAQVLDVARICGEVLFEKNRQPVFITLGANGMLVVTDAGFEHCPGLAVSGDIDIVGAGDSVMAGLVAGLCAGATSTEAASIGNLAASITIQQLGTTGTASREQLMGRFEAVQNHLTNR